ncbi:tRNA pseudouridine38-40 synthase [Strigomonas culicis]|uniref:tRNA pseudouridine38-40 synthase n=1 Tax=Strigomonas culicis TaxID=28005 RepID=S9UAZ8_9TRYP|nr:tRNA pseudouridine38-40 synthase [Strigomonas culicis]|eukprot:EPY25929.1 tRNA pseudouridine38-40 synthase [Strigomonas culicis]
MRADEAQRQARHQPGTLYRAAATPLITITSDAAAGAAPRRAPYAYDEDEDAGALGVADALTRVEVVEQELIDDTHVLFPPLDPTDTDAAPRPTAADEAVYVPGQHIVPAGWTRYRLEVQYQGGDFDGWSKSTARRAMVRDVHTGARHAVADATATDGGGSLPQAKAVLEEALAVAVDVSAVHIVASVIPEVGASVRRLTCHVDLPSDVEMQPRTILQRASLWLQQRQQPLALLVCQPCRNQNFHARQDGVQRVYVYRILNRIAPPLFDAGLQWHVDRHLDVPRMQRAAALLEGTHDFGYFADPKMYNALRRAAASRPSTTYRPHQEEHAPLAAGGGGGAAPKATFERGLSQLERAAALPTFNAYGQKLRHWDAKPARYQQAATNLPTIRRNRRTARRAAGGRGAALVHGEEFSAAPDTAHGRRAARDWARPVGRAGAAAQPCGGVQPSRARFRRERLPPAPAYGLTLWEVRYPPQHRADDVAYVDAGPLEDLHQSSVN